MKPPRIIGRNICYHIRTQCNNKEFRFETDSDFQLYENVLFRYVKKHGFELYNYALMHTHVHLIINIVNDFTIDRVMRSINQVFAHRYNRYKQRTGHLWMNPYKSSIVDSDAYALCNLRYLDRNALRAGIVVHPKEWQWGGFNFYAYGKPHSFLTPCPSYLALGTNPSERQEKYRKFVEEVMPSEAAKDKEWIRSRWPKATRR